MTGHIRQLEREIGTSLLQRSPVSLTLAGERLLPHARRMIAAAESAADSVKDLSDDRARALRVGVSATRPGDPLPPMSAARR
jgi:DNA-binding transcriptional LysR family regulator